MSESRKLKSRELRLKGYSLNRIAKEVGASQSSIRLWTSDIKLSEEQKLKIKEDSNKSRGTKNRDIYLKQRLKWQQEGKELAKLKDPTFYFFCALYWGEGSKNKNCLSLSNSDPHLLVTYISFLRSFFKLNDNEISIKINCYTDIKTLEEIEFYWLSLLNLPITSLKHSSVNKPKDSKRKLEYGTCTIQVNKTEILQKVYGAIQEIGNFSNTFWQD